MRAQTRKQIAKGSLVFSFALTLAAAGYSQTRAEPIREHKHEMPAGQCELPFRTYRDYIVVVQGSLGAKLRRNLIIDTGTDPSVIDRRVAQELRMAGTAGTLAVHDRVVDAEQAVLSSVRIGTLRAESLPVLIRDLGFLQKDLGIRIDGVIGLDVLSLSNFSIDVSVRPGPC